MMSEQNKGITIRRILVPLDSSRHSRAALEAAATLAKLTQAELHGLFVEDADWHRLGRLPSFGEVSELTGDLRSVEEQSMERQIGHLRNRIQQMIHDICQRSEVTHHLDTARGSIENKILEAAREADLITIGRAGHSFAKTKQNKLGKTAITIIREAEKPVLLMREGLSIASPPVAVYDGSHQSQRGVEVARDMANRLNSDLIVVALKNDLEAIDQERDRELEKLLEQSESNVKVKLQENSTIWSFANTVNRLNGGLLIIPKNQPLVENHSLNELLDYLHCPMLLTT